MKIIYDIWWFNVRKLRDGVGGNFFFVIMIDCELIQISRFMGDGVIKNIGDSMV